MNIPCSFTLEATFCGSNYGPLKHCHMHVGHLQETGAALCDAILNFSISEGKVADAMQVPANVRAAAQIEHAIGEEDGTQYSNAAHSIMSDNSSTFSSANITSQIPTGFNITSGASNTFSVVNSITTSTKTNSSSGTAGGDAFSGGHSELCYPAGKAAQEAADVAADRSAGMGVTVESNSRRNSASHVDTDYIRERSTNAIANAADIDSDSDAADGGGDSDLDSLVGTNASRADLIAAQASAGSGKEAMGAGYNRTGSNSTLQDGHRAGSSGAGTGYAELRHGGGGSNGDLSSQSLDRDGKRRIGAGNFALSSTMPALGANVKLSQALGMPMSATLSLESNESLQPQPPRNGTANTSTHRGFGGNMSPVAGFGSSSVNASLQGGTKNSSTGDAKRAAKDDSALTRSGYRVMDGMTTIGSSAALRATQDANTNNQIMATSSKEKGSGSSKKKKGTLKNTVSAKSQRSRSKDVTDTMETTDSDAERETLPRL